MRSLRLVNAGATTMQAPSFRSVYRHARRTLYRTARRAFEAALARHEARSAGDNDMTDLSPKARALIDASRRLLRAPQGERARIEAALCARLGAEVLRPDASPLAAGSVARRLIAGGVVVSVCVLGTMTYPELRPFPTAPVGRAESAPVATTSQGPQPMAAHESPAVVPARLAAARSEPPLRTAPKPPDRLAKEVALLSRATRVLRAGDTAAALQLLDEHRRKFPSGKLREERIGATAQALCLLGRVREGRGQLSQLAVRSPQAARAEEVCGPGAASKAQ